MKSDNELIAEFMGGWEYLHKTHFKGLMMVELQLMDAEDLRFNTSWEWLMPVVGKIDSLYHEVFPANEKVIEMILNKEWPVDEHYMDVIALPLATPIEEVYQAVIRFIKWYSCEVCGGKGYHKTSCPNNPGKQPKIHLDTNE